MSKTILIVGDISIDKYTHENKATLGGCALNVAYNLRTEKNNVRFCSTVGNDSFSSSIKETIKNNFNDYQIIQKNGDCCLQEIQIDKYGERIFVGYKGTILEDMTIDDYSIENIDIIYFPLFAQTKKLADSLMQLKKKKPDLIICCDFQDMTEFKTSIFKGYIESFDILFAGLTINDEDKIDFLRKYTDPTKILIITLGADGATVSYENKLFSQAAMISNNIVDTTGAGDAFAAGFLSSYMKQENIRQCISNAQKISSETIQFIGATRLSHHF